MLKVIKPAVLLIVYKIFLASPGNVRDERELARAVIEQIRAERAFRGRVDLACIAWDQSGVEVAMEAGLTTQEAIKRGLPKPSVVMENKCIKLIYRQLFVQNVN